MFFRAIFIKPLPPAVGYCALACHTRRATPSVQCWFGWSNFNCAFSNYSWFCHSIAWFLCLWLSIFCHCLKLLTLLSKAVFISLFLYCVNNETWLIIVDNFKTCSHNIVLEFLLIVFNIHRRPYSIDLCNVIMLKTRRRLVFHIQNDHRIKPSVKRHNSRESL